MAAPLKQVLDLVHDLHDKEVVLRYHLEYVAVA
jgi:hypothetical protein